jgi:hypothetical protein
VAPGRFRLRRFVLWSLVLLAGSFVVWDRIATRGLAADVALIAARGEPTAPIDRDAVSLTADERNAARLYAAAVERMQEAPPDETAHYRRLDVDNPASAQGTLADLESRYRKDTPALQFLDQATPLDFKEFGRVAPELYDNQEPLAALGALNGLRADLLSMRGRGDEAAAVLVASVRLQRTMLRSFYRYQASSRLLGSLRTLLRRTSPAPSSLAKLQRAFEALPDTDSLTVELLQARARFLDDIARPGATLGEAVAGRLLRPWLITDWRQQLRIFEEAIAFARGSVPERFDRADAFEQRIVSAMMASQRRAALTAWLAPRRGGAFGGMSLPAAAYGLAVRRIAIATLAAERFRRANGGAAPPGLDGLVPAYLGVVPQDPFSGKPIIYAKGSGDYRVYSVDNNRTDDGGVLYGIGSGGQLIPLRGAPRDYGIRVPLTPATDHKEKP